MPKPICVPCQAFYQPDRNGVVWQENMPKMQSADQTTFPTGLRPGWVPYKLWSADRWKCPGCGHLLITGHGKVPIAEHGESKFTQCQALSTLTVNDC